MIKYILEKMIVDTLNKKLVRNHSKNKKGKPHKINVVG